VLLNQLDLNKLNVFVVAAELGGFTAAAKRLGLTRSAISQSMAALERSLGFDLFHRTGRQLALTERARTLLDEVRLYQSALENILAELTDQQREPAGTARLGIFVGFSKARLTDFLARFLRRHPHVTAKLLFLPQAELVERLLDRRIDAALSVHPLNRQARGLDSRRLFEEELVLVSGAKLHIEKPSFDQVRQLPIIEYYEAGELTRAWIQHHFGADPGQLQVRAYAGAVDFVVELIQKNVGIGIVPRYVAEPLLKSRRLRQFRTKRPELVDAIWLNQVRGARLDPAAGCLIAELSEAFARAAAASQARP
jgi:DNA-binding transcriptional LysR family regulator